MAAYTDRMREILPLCRRKVSYSFMTRAALVIFSLGSIPAGAAIIDRIAATVDREVITLSEVSQIIEVRLIARVGGETEEAYRKRVLDSMISQDLRYRDVARFGAEDVAKDAIESRFLELQRRFPSSADYQQALVRSELTEEELKAFIKRQLQVEAYVAERFSPLVFVSLEEIETYYNSTWLPQRRARGVPEQPLSEVREEIRALLKASRLEEEIQKWTVELRARANVDIYIYR
jgi:hypothetical protein